MSAFFIMIGASLLLALGFLGAFIWSVRTDQYEDDYTPSVRMLFDHPVKPAESKPETNDLTNTTKTESYGTTEISVRQ